MVLRKNHVAGLSDPGELCRLARRDDTDLARAALSRLVELLGTRSIGRGDITDDDLRWLELASRLRLPEVSDWVESLAAVRAVEVFVGGGRWYPLLTRLMGGEVTVPCPACGRLLLLRHRAGRLALVIVNGVVHDIRPAAPDSLAGPELELYRAVEAERPDLAAVLLQLFASLTCPGCGARFSLTGRR